MRIHISEPSTHSLPLRGRLLSQSLRRHLQRRGEALVPPVPRQTGPQAVRDTATRAALPAKPHAPQAASLGLGVPDALHDGPATLLLTTSLSSELETFGGPDAWTAAGTLPLVLQGYSRAILTDRADVAGSVGFAPWIPLALADRFPVAAPHPSLSTDQPPRILILDHGAPEGQANVLRRALRDLDCAVRLVTFDTDHAEMGAGLTADLHLHLGYGPGLPVAGFSPFDSLLSGLYTLVLPAAGHGAGKALRALCAGRSYGDLAPTLSDLEARARTMLSRISAIRQAGERQNPELARFAAINAAARAADYARFDAVFDSAPALAKAA